CLLARGLIMDGRDSCDDALHDVDDDAISAQLRHYLRFERCDWEKDDREVAKLVDELSQCLLDPFTALPPPPTAPAATEAELLAERERRAEAVESKWSSTLARFEATQSKVQDKITKHREFLAQEAEKDLRFKPAIDRKSRRIAHEFPTFLERQASAVAWRDKHMTDEREQKFLEEDQAVTTRPNLCLCGQPTKHSPLCQQFLSLCIRANAHLPIQRKTHAMKRSVDDMLAYARAKHERQVERSLAAHEKEAANAPFTPTLNPRSIKIYEAMVQAGKKTVRPRSHDEGPRANGSFRPEINPKSRALVAALTETQTVFERLEAHADARQLKLAEANVARIDAHIRHVKAIGKDDLQLQRILQHLSPKGKGSAPPVTRVVVGSSDGFIMDNFTSDTAQPQLLGQTKTETGLFKGASYDTPGTLKKSRIGTRT
ncbi:hypothetical protein SDRG_16685, partial [Saprolegnia diclina VS20]